MIYCCRITPVLDDNNVLTFRIIMKVKSFPELQKLKTKYQTRESSEEDVEGIVLIKVGMATCGIASGARDIKKVLIEECEHNAVDARVKQTGCLGYCYAEPMVEVLRPGAKPKVFGYVDKNRAKEIIEKYIIQGEEVDGEIPVSFKTIDD
jgi:NADP-reducing hydrogenase subunit HndB